MDAYRRNQPYQTGVVFFILAILAFAIPPHPPAFADTGTQPSIEPTEAYFNYPVFYTRDKNGDIFVAWGDGHTDRFVKRDGIFASPTGSSYAFIEYQPTKYVLQLQDGTAFFFDSPIHKKITKVTASEGKILRSTRTRAIPGSSIPPLVRNDGFTGIPPMRPPDDSPWDNDDDRLSPPESGYDTNNEDSLLDKILGIIERLKGSSGNSGNGDSNSGGSCGCCCCGCSTNSAGRGGGESKPLENIQPSYFRQIHPANPANILVSPEKTSFLDAIFGIFVGRKAYADTLDEQIQPEPSVVLRNILPSEGPVGTTAVPITPLLPYEFSSKTVDTAAVDFVDSNSLNLATVFAIKTLREPYDHDYPICNRFNGYTLETAAALPLPEVMPGITEMPWFWYAATTKDPLVEETFIFAVFVSEGTKTFTVDSRWLSQQYPLADLPEYDYIFNFQIWASSSQEAYELLRRTLANLSQTGPDWEVVFANTTEPVAPTIMIKSAELNGGNVRMIVQSWLTESRTLTFSGGMRELSDPEENITFAHDITLEPGFNQVELPLGNVLNAVVEVQADGFMDKVYISSGAWFSFKDGGETSSISLLEPECAVTANFTASYYVLGGCAEITGNVGTGGWAGVARALNPNDMPVNVSEYQALTFFARGDGKPYRVSLETKSVRLLDSADFHQYIFQTSGELQQFVIPLAAFSQRGGDPGKLMPLSGDDVVSIAWATVSSPLDSINLSIDGVAFIRTPVLGNTTVLANTANTSGPYEITTQIIGDGELSAVDLFYSVDAGASFTQAAMTADGNTFSGAIPGQPLGSEVWYYVKAVDGADTTETVYRFQVSEHPYLSADDFSDAHPINSLGADSGTFGTDSGSAILASYEDGAMRLEYDVSAPDSYAGYYSLLKQADLTPYTVVTFMVKGAAGGKKALFGLRDSAGNETKIIISEYLATGITTAWQKVIIPLAAFTRITDWERMENFSVAFENQIGSTGIVYLDDIQFEQLVGIPVVIDNFNNISGENGLAGALWSVVRDGGNSSIDAVYDSTNRRGTGAGYRLSYAGVTGTDWALAGMDLNGLNASSLQTLSFYVKGATGNEQPNIYLVSGEGTSEAKGFVNIEDYAIVTTIWQKVDVPLAAFSSQGVDLGNLSYLQWVFEWGEMAGTIYLDDVILDISSGIAMPDIKANGLDEGVKIRAGDALSITVALAAGNLAGQNADWWLVRVRETPSPSLHPFDLATGLWHAGNLAATFQGALFDLPQFQVLNTSDLAVGTHSFYFGFDLEVNGRIDTPSLKYNKVVVNVTSQ